jgi:hypothetical protein
MKRVHTANSIYEVDEDNKKVRRASGLNKPTPSFGEDGVWQSYTELYEGPFGMWVRWGNDGRVTWTSPITEMEEL